MSDPRTTFVRESREQVQALSDGLLAVERDADAGVDAPFRAAHTLKGNARAEGFPGMGEVAHALETVLDALREGRVDPDEPVMDAGFRAVDALESMLDEVAQHGEVRTDADAVAAAVREAVPAADADGGGGGSGPTGGDDDATPEEAGTTTDPSAPDTAAASDDLTAEEALANASEFDDLDALAEDVDAEEFAGVEGFGTFDELLDGEPDEPTDGRLSDPAADESGFDAIRSGVDLADPDDLERELADVQFGDLDPDDQLDIDELVDLEPDAPAADERRGTGGGAGADDADATDDAARPGDGAADDPADDPTDDAPGPADDPADVSVEEALANASEFDDLDALAEDVDAEEFAGVEGYGTFDELLDEESEPTDAGTTEAPDAAPDDRGAGGDGTDDGTASADAGGADPRPGDVDPAVPDPEDADVAAMGADLIDEALGDGADAGADGDGPGLLAGDDADGDAGGPSGAGDDGADTGADATDAGDEPDAGTDPDAAGEETGAPGEFELLKDIEALDPDSVDDPFSTPDLKEPSGTDSGGAAGASSPDAGAAAGTDEADDDATPAADAATGPGDGTGAATDAGADPTGAATDAGTDPADAAAGAGSGAGTDAPDPTDDGGLADIDVGEAFEPDDGTAAFAAEFEGAFGGERAAAEPAPGDVATTLDPDALPWLEPVADGPGDGLSPDERAAGVDSLTVDVEDADALMALVEDLLTDRMRAEQALADGADEAVADALGDLKTGMERLEETVREVRLVPLESATRRLPRVVRDVAREGGKEVRFETEGESVRLDRTVVDRVGDPLTHVVRNAVDHGIEPPAERREAGKDPEGVVELTAERVRDRIVVEVRDDGRGIDPDAVRAAAVEEGVVSPEEAAVLTDDEACQLVFHPGFSTADEVTDTSGRGVGMDVVDRVASELDGDVTVESTPGEGTTVRLTLPVTVSVSELLFVRAGDERFAIPAEDVARVEEVSPDRLDGDGYVVARAAGEAGGPAAGEAGTGGEAGVAAGNEVDAEAPAVDAGGGAVVQERHPLVSLGEALSVPGAGEADGGVVVHLREGVGDAVLHCDAVGEWRRAVVKPYEDLLSDADGVSGATVVGDGRLVNVVDVASLPGVR